MSATKPARQATACSVRFLRWATFAKWWPVLRSDASWRSGEDKPSRRCKMPRLRRRLVRMARQPFLHGGMLAGYVVVEDDVNDGPTGTFRSVALRKRMNS